MIFILRKSPIHFVNGRIDHQLIDSAMTPPHSGGQTTSETNIFSILAVRKAILRSIVTCGGRSRVGGVSIWSVGLLLLRVD